MTSGKLSYYTDLPFPHQQTDNPYLAFLPPRVVLRPQGSLSCMSEEFDERRWHSHWLVREQWPHFPLMSKDRKHAGPAEASGKQEWPEQVWVAWEAQSQESTPHVSAGTRRRPAIKDGVASRKAIDSEQESGGGVPGARKRKRKESRWARCLFWLPKRLHEGRWPGERREWGPPALQSSISSFNNFEHLVCTRSRHLGDNRDL